MKKRSFSGLMVYLVLVFVLTYGYEIFVLPGLMAGGEHGTTSAASTLAVSAAMLLPTLSMLLTRLMTGQGFRPLLLAPHLKGNVRYYLAAWFAPMGITLVGIAVYFAVFPGRFDPQLGYLTQLGADFSVMPGWVIVAAQAVQATLVAPVVNLIFALGEEWGWRGYMMPALLKRFRFGPACLIGGIIWGLWHAPLTVMGHNYGVGYVGYPVTGILTMCFFCVLLGTFLTWLTVKTGSCLPAALAHGGINGCAALGVLLAKPEGGVQPLLGPAPSGLLGCAGLLLLALFCLKSAAGRVEIGGEEKPE